MGMDPLTLAIAGQAGGQIIGAMSGDKANKQNQNAQNAWSQKIFGQGQQMLGQGQSMSPEIQKFLDQLNGKQSDVLGGGNIDINSIFSGGGYNAGSDALNQVLKGGTDKSADSYLNSMVTGGGNPFDTSDMFSKLGALDDQNLTKSVAMQQGTAGSLGARFGSANADRTASLIQQANTATGARNAGIQQSSYEAGQGRAMGAAGQLNANIMQMLGIKTGAASALNQAGQFEAGARLSGAQSNQKNALDVFGANQSAQQARINEILAGLGLGNQAAGQANDYRSRIFGTMAGGPGPGMATGSGVPGAIGDSAGFFAMLQMLQGGGKKTP
jgi:hypothetical protein